MATGKQKGYILSEALDYLDNLEVSSSENLYSSSCKLQ